MKEFLKKVFADGVRMRDWLTFEEQEEIESGKENFDDYLYIAQRRKNNCEFWVTACITLIAVISIISLYCLFNQVVGS